MKIWFTADTHWGHTNIIKYCSRPFLSSVEQDIYDKATAPTATPEQKQAWATMKLSKDSVKRHDEQLIGNWNKYVSAEDTVYHLGDFYFGNKQYGQSLITQLNGNICLIRGNHDKSAESIKDEFVWGVILNTA